MTKKVVLHSQSTYEAAAALVRSPEERAAALAELHRQGFRRFVQRRFNLTPHQVDELDLVKDRDLDDVITRALAAVIQRGGKIELVQEGHDPANLRVEIYVRKGEVGIRFEC